MKRSKERGDRSPTVSYCIGCQLNQLIRIFLSRASLCFKGREVPPFSLPGSAGGARVLIHSAFMACFGHQLQAQISRSSDSRSDNLVEAIAESLPVFDSRMRCQVVCDALRGEEPGIRRGLNLAWCL